MKRSVALLIVIALFVVTGCKNSSGGGTDENDAFKGYDWEIIPTDEGRILTIDATSSKEGHGADNVLDNNAKTSWIPAGSGENEGITIRFLEPEYIETLKIECPSDFEGKFQLYINGGFSKIISPNSSKKISRKNVKTLFFKVGSSGDVPIAVEELQINPGITDDENKIKAPLVIGAKITTSSMLDPEISYAPDLMFDSQLDTGWTEGAVGNGIGENVSIKFDTPIIIEGIYLANGYQRSEEHYKANARVKTLILSNDIGDTETITLNDEMDYIYYILDEPMLAKNLAMTIGSVFPGTKYEDTVLSEIRFAYKGVIIDLETGFEERMSEQVAAECAGTILEELLDKSFQYERDIEMDAESQTSGISIRLRSNGSFVIYQTENYRDRKQSGDVTSVDTESETIYEGNWQIRSADADQAKVYIYGKKYASTDYDVWVDPYADYDPENEGKYQSSSATSIFSDTITVSYSDKEACLSSETLPTDNEVECETDGENIYLISGTTVYGFFPVEMEIDRKSAYYEEDSDYYYDDEDEYY